MIRTARCLGGPKDGEVLANPHSTLIVLTPRIQKPYALDTPPEETVVVADRHEYRFQTLALLDGSSYDCWAYAGVIGTPAHCEAGRSARPREETQMKTRANVEAVVVRSARCVKDGKINLYADEEEIVKVDLGYVVGTQPTREDVLRMPKVVEACMDGDKPIPGSELEVAFARVNFCS